MNKWRKPMAIVLLFVMLTSLLAGCGAKEEQRFETMEDFSQAKIGVMTGSSFDLLSKEYFPEAESVYHMNMTDLILNLKQGKVDGILMDKGFYTPLQWEGEGLACIEMQMPATDYAVAFPKDGASEELKSQMDAFIAEQTENGWIGELGDKWFAASEPQEVPDLSHLTGENGTIRVATTVESKPFAYLKDGQNSGFDMDFIVRFAEEYGYALELDVMDFGALLPSLSAGRYDLAISSITVTDERRESVDFSEVYFVCPIVMVVLPERAAAAAGQQTLEDFADGKIGILTGSSHDATVKNLFPNAERLYFSTTTDMALAVEQGKIDCYVEDESFLPVMVWEGASVEALPERVTQVTNGFVFPQTEESRPLREQLNAFIADAKADGTIDGLKEKWLGDTEPTEHPDYTTLTGENGTIHLGVVVESKPMIYMYDGLFTGMEIELITMFGQEYGYAFDMENVPFESVIAGLTAGKYDMAASSMNITPEREESVDFTDPYSEFDVVLVLKSQNGQPKRGMTLADFEHARIGVMTGSVYVPVAQERFPEAEHMNYSIMPDLILAVEQEKVDGFITEIPYAIAAMWEGAQIEVLDEVIRQSDAGFIFQKHEDTAELRAELDAFILQSWENGVIEELTEKWFNPTEPTDLLSLDALTGENGTLRVAVAPDLKPISYVKNNQLTGYEIELLILFAQEYGYQLDLHTMTFDAILPGVTAGKYDIGSGAVTITEERAQSVDFSESHMSTDVIMATKASAAVEENSFWDDLKESFEKTFIREDRWKLIVEGVGVTMLISLSAAVAGSALGFGLYMLGRSDLKPLRGLARGIARIYSRIVAGTPVVVILMILFYVIFGSIRDISGVLVAVIGFSLTFGAFVYDHMTVSVNSVDWGQTEAAYALGYTKNMTFFRVIFPQAMTIFLPSYCGQAVELIKATAVVGYIAVNDLTKMGDIIRSNTYEAFFPLIATAVIYFLLTWVLSLLLGLVKVRFEPKRRSKEEILKGVKTV